MTTLRALLYADARSLLNGVRAIRSSPARLLLWLLFAAVLAMLFWLRAARAFRGLSRAQAHPLFVPDLIVCGALMLLAVALVAGDRYAGLFPHPAAARFIVASPASPFVTAVYLHVRQIAVAGLRQAFLAIYVLLVYLPANLPSGDVARDLALLLLAMIAASALPLARLVMDPWAAVLARIAGVLLGAFAVAAALRDAALAFGARVPFERELLELPALHPGTVLLAPSGPRDAAVAAALLAISVAAFAYVGARAADAFPRIYDASLRRFARIERVRNAGTGTLFAFRPQSAVRNTVVARGVVPGGVAVFVWKAWLEYRRANDLRRSLLEAAVCIAVGYVAGRSATGARPAAIGVVVGPVLSLAFVLASARAASLAVDLRRPLFWLSDATLFERLAALTLSQSWRPIAWTVLIAAGLAAGGTSAFWTAGSAIVTAALIVLACTIGYASYAIAPNATDQFGPLRFVRVFLAYVLLMPPLAVSLLAGLLLHDMTIALVAATVMLTGEAGVLIGFAAWRLDGRAAAAT